MPSLNPLLPSFLGALRRLLAWVAAWLPELLAVPRCAACDQRLRQPAVFCPVCAATVVQASAPRRTMVPGGQAAPAVTQDGVVVCGYAQYGGAVADALQRFKYDDRPDLARPLGALLLRALRETRPASRGEPPGTGWDWVVPVPLHPRRLAERGYNQAALLARQVQKELGAPLSTAVLRRRVHTSPQAKLGRTARARNLHDAFHVAQPGQVRHKRVLLVDDVATTGATLAACAAALRAAGVTSVTALVVAIADR